jgi:hypothetical protein
MTASRLDREVLPMKAGTIGLSHVGPVPAEWGP